MASCYYNDGQNNDFTKEFLKFFTRCDNPDEADLQLYMNNTGHDCYTVEMVQGSKKHMEYHWIDCNYYVLWYGDDIEGFRYRSDGTVLPETKDFFYSLIETDIQDTPARCGYHMGLVLSCVIDANKVKKG